MGLVFANGSTPPRGAAPVKSRIPAMVFFLLCAFIQPVMRGTGHPTDKVGGDPVDPRIHLLCERVFYEDGWIAPELGLARVPHYINRRNSGLPEFRTINRRKSGKPDLRCHK